MLYRTIPALSKPVSALSIGSWRTFEKMEFEDIIAVLEACFDAGINFIDDCRYGTAPGVPMGIPTTEVIVGRALKAIGRPRDSYVIANKLWWDQYPASSLREQLMRALARLDDETVELIYVDRPDRFRDAHPDLPFDEEDLTCAIAEEMGALIKEGVVQAYGFANAKPDAIRRIIEITDRNGLTAPAVAQIRYNLAEPEASRSAELDALHASHGLMLTATTTMAGGVLSGKYLVEGAEPRRFTTEKAAESAQALDVARGLVALGEEAGLPASALAMAFPLIKDNVASVVFGARSVEQVQQNLRALEATTPQLLARIGALAVDPVAA